MMVDVGRKDGCYVMVITAVNCAEGVVLRDLADQFGQEIVEVDEANGYGAISLVAPKR